MTQRICLNCEFAEFLDKEWEHGVCRKRPPVVMLTATTVQPQNQTPVPVIWNVSGEFPTVTGGDWCGEFRVRGEDK